MSNVKNYTEQNGDKTVIGGKLVIEGELLFDEGSKASGGVIENQDDSTATTVAAIKEDFNELLLKLKDSGLMKEGGK